MKCRGWPSHSTDSTYSCLPWLSRTRKSPECVSSSATSARGMAPWYHSCSCRGFCTSGTSCRGGGSWQGWGGGRVIQPVCQGRPPGQTGVSWGGGVCLSLMPLILTNHVRGIRAPGASNRLSQARARQSWDGEPRLADLKPGFCLFLQAPAAQLLPEQGEPGGTRLQHALGWTGRRCWLARSGDIHNLESQGRRGLPEKNRLLWAEPPLWGNLVINPRHPGRRGLGGTCQRPMAWPTP